MEPAEFEILHFTPGRIRIRHSKVKSNAAFAEQIQQKLSSVRGINQVKANPLTGSVLVLYDNHNLESTRSLLEVGRALDLFPEKFVVEDLEDWQRPQAEEPGGEELVSLADVIDGLFAILNSRVTKATGGVTDLKELVPLGLSFLGFVKALRSKPTPIPWHSYFWYAFGIYRSLHAGEWEAEAEGDGD